MELRLFGVIFGADGVSRSGPIPVAVWSLGGAQVPLLCNGAP
jgi:hypothetical protein